MLTVSSIPSLRDQLSAWRCEQFTIAFVPTMGNLHAGHLSLVNKGSEIADKVVASIFVNPTQFVQGEDYGAYPRTFQQDSKKLSDIKTDLLFYPDTNDIYPGDVQFQTQIQVPGLDNIFCGEYRPGHFSGVATVVAKLFNIVQPDIAIFGEKDYQQLLVIRKLVNDLFIPVEIIGMPTVREEDGLAMSSRNSYLEPEERKIAPLIYQQLTQTKEAILAGENNYAILENQAVSVLNQSGFITEYFAIRDAETLGEPGKTGLIALAAARLGKARLIDNISIRR